MISREMPARPGGLPSGGKQDYSKNAVAIGYRALSATNATLSVTNEGLGTIALGTGAGETTSR